MKIPKVRSTKPGGYHDAGPGRQGARDFAQWYKAESLKQWELLDVDAVARLADAVVHAQEHGKRIYVMGNGGSAATSSHVATDLCKTAAVKGVKPVECVSLADNAAFMTAIGNDLSFDEVFSRQLESLLRSGDLVLLISGSGNSPNLVNAARFARQRGAKTAALLGFDGGQLRRLVDIPVLVPSEQYGVIEDMHLAINHILTFFLKQRK